jgi:branched-chain amino acid transport system permease protein
MNCADLIHRPVFRGGVLGSVVLIVLPAVLGGNSYAYDLAALAAIYAIIAVSWDVFSGLTGEFSFGQSLFVGVAAYAAAISQAHLSLPPYLAFLLGVSLGGLTGTVLGLMTLRHAAASFAVVTMAAQLAFHRSLFVCSGLFGGEEGVLMPASTMPAGVPAYSLSALIAVGCLIAAMWLRGTHFGLQLRASGGDTRTSAASGVAVPKTRVLGATLSGALAGVGGSLLASHYRLANHEMAGDAFSGLILLLCLTGGTGTILGPWLAAIAYVAFLREWLMSLGKLEPVLVFGTMLLLIWVFPDGLAAGIKSIRLERFARRRHGGGGAESRAN